MTLLKLDYTADKKTIHSINLDLGVVLEVFGDPDNGDYEWMLFGGAPYGTGPAFIEHSNCGYGDPTIALRDGLCHYHGIPDSVEVITTQVRP